MNSEKGKISKSITWYVRSVIVILFITAMAKFISVYRSHGTVDNADPIFVFARVDLVLVLVGMLEMGCGLLLHLLSNQRRQLLLIMWLGFLFLIYRVGLLLVGYTGPCSCFGKPRSWQDFQFFTSLDVIMKWVLGYMLVLSSVFFGILSKRLHSARISDVSRMPA